MWNVAGGYLSAGLPHPQSYQHRTGHWGVGFHTEGPFIGGLCWAHGRGSGQPLLAREASSCQGRAGAVLGISSLGLPSKGEAAGRWRGKQGLPH